MPIPAELSLALSDLLTKVLDWLVGLMTTVGAPGAGLAVALENFFPPIPSEVILPLAGLTASRGHFSLVSAIVWTTIGSVVGALGLYWLGAKLGLDRLRRVADRLPLAKVIDIDRTVGWFSRHGRSSVLVGRLLPLFRSLISIPAGVERMPIVQFLGYTALGSGVWNTVLIVAGWKLGESWHLVERWTGVLQNVILVVVGCALAYLVVHRLRGRRRAERDARSESPGDTETDRGRLS